MFNPINFRAYNRFEFNSDHRLYSDSNTENFLLKENTVRIEGKAIPNRVKRVKAKPYFTWVEVGGFAPVSSFIVIVIHTFPSLK